MVDKHRVFISYHHLGDQDFKDEFVREFAPVLLDWSVRRGDIPDGLPTETIRQRIRDEHLRDSTVTIVLVGAKTWQRKHVDWEIGSSLRATKLSPRSGLLGILLPTYPATAPNTYNPRTIPPRLDANVRGDDPFAKLRFWPRDPALLQHWIHEAFVRRSRQPDPDNSLPAFGNNRTTEQWQG